MGHGDHKVWEPSKRWAVLVGYWSVSLAVAHARGLLKDLLEQDVKTPNNPWYLISFVLHIPVMMAVWDYSAYAFNRPVRYFSAIVYPIAHSCDTFRWYYSFDFGRSLIQWISKFGVGQSLLSFIMKLINTISPITINDTDMFVQFLGGWIVYAIFMMVHRATFEFMYLPEHHPPREIDGKQVRGNGMYIFVGIMISIPFQIIYHYHGDMIWGFALQYAYNLYVALRIRIPDPWDKCNHIDESKVEPWRQYLLPGTY